MKKSLIMAVAAVLVFAGCRDKMFVKRTLNVPIYMSYENLRSSGKISFQANKTLEKTGKIYFHKNYIFINEPFKGIHIYNNSNPSLPVKEGFINIPGNVDMAVKGNILYADSYIDLLAIDINNISNPILKSRIEQTFPYQIPSSYNEYGHAKIDSSKGVVIGYETKVVKEETEYCDYCYDYYYDKRNYVAFDASVSNSVGVSTGKGGSLARFTIANDYLYTVFENTIKPFNIQNMSEPVIQASVETGREIETIFYYRNRLYLGTTTGMMIYDIEHNPSAPFYMSEVQHIRSCDPVVVQDNFAFVTTRFGRTCGGGTNQLMVIDVENSSDAKLLQIYPLDNPYGLGIRDSLLFICDGNSGLKIYNAKDVFKIDENLLFNNKDIVAKDVIVLDNILFCISEEGLYQYNFSDVKNISELSVIETNN